MNFRENYAAAIAANDTTRISNLEAQAEEYAYERACELDSPNSLEFDQLQESILKELLG